MSEQSNWPHDKDFNPLDLPTTSRGWVRINSWPGIRVNHIYYRSHAFLDRSLAKTTVPVRYNPSDMDEVYVFIRGKWVLCFSEHPRLKNRSLTETQLAIKELRRKVPGGYRAITAQHIVDFLDHVEDSNQQGNN